MSRTARIAAIVAGTVPRSPRGGPGCRGPTCSPGRPWQPPRCRQPPTSRSRRSPPTATSPTPTGSPISSRTRSGQWVHSTVLDVPGQRIVHVTVYKYDGASGLRNPFFGQPAGVVGGPMPVDGKPIERDRTRRRLAHVRHPRARRHRAAPGRRRRREEPVRASRRARWPRRTGRSRSRSAPASRGHYRWQCFVPCAAGFIYGFGGPMQTIGYMDGFLNVVLMRPDRRTARPAPRRAGSRHLGRAERRSPRCWSSSCSARTCRPGNVRAEASEQTQRQQGAASAILTPIVCSVVRLLRLRARRRSAPRGDAIEDGPPIRGNRRLQLSGSSRPTRDRALPRRLRHYELRPEGRRRRRPGPAPDRDAAGHQTRCRCR